MWCWYETRKIYSSCRFYFILGGTVFSGRVYTLMALKIQTATLKGRPRSPTIAFWLYNGLDAAVTHEIHEKIAPQLDEITAATYEFERMMQGPAMTLMTRGILVDMSMRDKVRDIYTAKLEVVEGNLNTKAQVIWDKDLNPRSSPQLGSFFYDTMGIEEIFNHKPGKGDVRTCDREALETIAKENKEAQPFIELILDARDMTKKRSVLKSGIDPDGRMRASYNIGGTKGGRWSSSANAFGGGTNHQNLEDLMRRVFIPSPGYKMAYSDLDRAESLVVAYLAEDDAYKEAHKAHDLHSMVASWIWDIPESEAETTKIYRDFSARHLAKQCAHASNYGATPYGLARKMHISQDLAKQFQTRYFKAFPGIQDRFQKRIAQQLRNNGRLITPLSRRRAFFKRRDDPATLRDAYNSVPQSVVADVLNIGLHRVWTDLDGNEADVRILANVHDAILWEVRDTTTTKSLIDSVEQKMAIPVTIHGDEMTIPVSSTAGYNWGKLADDNPCGLTDFGSDLERAQRRPETTPVLHN